MKRTYDSDIVIEEHEPQRFEGVDKWHGVGHWASHLEYDALAIVDGLVWRRTSFGDENARSEREDWVLDLPNVGVSITRHALPDGRWGKWNHWPDGGVESMRQAMRQRVHMDLASLHGEIRKTALELGGMVVARQLMQRFMAQ